MARETVRGSLWRWVQPWLVPAAAAIVSLLVLEWLWPALHSKEALEELLATSLAASPLRWFGYYPVVLVAQLFPIFSLATTVLVLNVLGRVIPGTRPTPLSRVIVAVIMLVVFEGAFQLELFPHLPSVIREQYALGSAPDPGSVLAYAMITLLIVSMAMLAMRDLAKRN